MTIDNVWRLPLWAWRQYAMEHDAYVKAASQQQRGGKPVLSGQDAVNHMIAQGVADDPH